VFYLNYVGCKVFYKLPEYFCKISFTLTMWDVKIRVTVNAVVTAVGFTLTMWDVKH